MVKAVLTSRFTRALTFAVVLLLAFALLAPAVFASEASNQVCAGIGATGSGSCGSAGAGLDGAIRFAINTVSIIAGIIGVIMVIIAGLKYITSQGDSSQISGAKNTLLYALVGLAVAALAQIIVRFVLTEVNQAAGAGSQLAVLCVFSTAII